MNAAPVFLRLTGVALGARFGDSNPADSRPSDGRFIHGMGAVTIDAPRRSILACLESSAVNGMIKTRDKFCAEI